MKLIRINGDGIVLSKQFWHNLAQCSQFFTLKVVYYTYIQLITTLALWYMDGNFQKNTGRWSEMFMLHLHL